eukprot:3780103-Lingulodinium_polyedra.AAC.1
MPSGRVSVSLLGLSTCLPSRGKLSSGVKHVCKTSALSWPGTARRAATTTATAGRRPGRGCPP